MTGKQLKLIVMEPTAKELARRDDPVTSHEAARGVVASGRASDQRAAVARAVRRWPGRTGAELAVLMSVDRHVPSRRLKECESAGWVSRGSRRRCTVRGTSAQVWNPAAVPPVIVSRGD